MTPQQASAVIDALRKQHNAIGLAENRLDLFGMIQHAHIQTCEGFDSRGDDQTTVDATRDNILVWLKDAPEIYQRFKNRPWDMLACYSAPRCYFTLLSVGCHLEGGG